MSYFLRAIGSRAKTIDDYLGEVTLSFLEECRALAYSVQRLKARASRGRNGLSNVTTLPVSGEYADSASILAP